MARTKKPQAKKAKEVPLESESESDSELENSEPLADSTRVPSNVANGMVAKGRDPRISEESEDEDQQAPSTSKGATNAKGVGTSKSGPKRKRQTMTQRAGLQFPVARIRRNLKSECQVNIVTKTAAVYAAGVIEYLVAEVGELSGEVAKVNRKARITPRHINLAIQNDHELKKLLENVTIPSAGVRPHIENVLLPPRSNENKGGKTVAAANKAGTSNAADPGTRNKAGGSKQGNASKNVKGASSEPPKKRKKLLNTVPEEPSDSD